MTKRTAVLVVAGMAMVAAITAAGPAEARDRQNLNNVVSAYSVGKSAFDVSTHVIGVAPKPNPLLTGYQLGQAGAGFAVGYRQGYGYQSWQKPEVVSSKEGARTLGYPGGVLSHRAADRIQGAFRRR